MTVDWPEIAAQATMKSIATLPQCCKDEVSMLIVKPPAAEGLKRWWHLVEQP